MKAIFEFSTLLPYLKHPPQRKEVPKICKSSQENWLRLFKMWMKLKCFVGMKKENVSTNTEWKKISDEKQKWSLWPSKYC